MKISIHIETCSDCRHLQHSGAFTPGGALPVCSHNDACYGNHAKVFPGEDAVSVLVRIGMQEKYAKRLLEIDRRDMDGIDDLILLKGWKKGDCIPWMHRVPYHNQENKIIPEWCPLRHGAKY